MIYVYFLVTVLVSLHPNIQCKPQIDPYSRDRLQNAQQETMDLTTPAKPRLISEWPSAELNVGQISSVSIDQNGNPVIFHRGSHSWDIDTFNLTNHYQHEYKGSIPVDTILSLDAHTGEILSGKGANLFYMPHGMTIDRHGHIWVTDVALHQAFKFRSDMVEPIITIGVRFEPGSTSNHLCMPTSVAVASRGEVFISDGYCNNRILKFNAAGRILRIIPQAPEFISLQVPHGLTLLENLDLLCVADRENMRVVCPRAGLGRDDDKSYIANTIQEPDLGRVFDVASHGNFVYAVNGPTSPQIPVRGFTIDPLSEKIIDHWGSFINPHSIAVNINGTSMYVSEIGPNKLWKFQLK